jgi:hypothetical protein
MRPANGKFKPLPPREETANERASLEIDRAISLAKDSTTSATYLHDLLSHEFFYHNVMSHQHPKKYYDLRNVQEIPSIRKEIWEAASTNPNLAAEDIAWIVEELFSAKNKTLEKDSLPGILSQTDYNILKHILLHPHTPDDIREQLEALTLHGKLVFSESGKELIEEWDEPNWHVAQWRKETLLEAGQKSVWLDPKFDEKIQEEIRQKRITDVPLNPTHGLPKFRISDS